MLSGCYDLPLTYISQPVLDLKICWPISMLTSDLHLSASFRLENLLTYIYVDLYPYKAYFFVGDSRWSPIQPPSVSALDALLFRTAYCIIWSTGRLWTLPVVTYIAWAKIVLRLTVPFPEPTSQTSWCIPPLHTHITQRVYNMCYLRVMTSDPLSNLYLWAKIAFL